MNLSSVIACSKLLKGTSDPRVLEQACGILRNLSTNNMAAGQICNEGAVDAITALLKNEDAKVVEQAAGTLRNVSANKDLRAAIVQAGALPLLIDLLSHVDEKVQEQAVLHCAIFQTLSNNHDFIINQRTKYIPSPLVRNPQNQNPFSTVVMESRLCLLLATAAFVACPALWWHRARRQVEQRARGLASPR